MSHQVVALLLEERSKIDRALAVLAPVRRGRPPKSATALANALASADLAPRRGRPPGSKNRTARAK